MDTLRRQTVFSYKVYNQFFKEQIKSNKKKKYPAQRVSHGIKKYKIEIGIIYHLYAGGKIVRTTIMYR